MLISMAFWRTLCPYHAFALLLGLCQCISSAEQRAGQPLKNFTRSQIIDMIRNEDMSVPPNYDKDIPTVIKCRIFVENFDSISEQEMDFTLTILLQLNWVDEDFIKYLPRTNTDSYVEIDSNNLDQLWVPDLFFPNEKMSYYHDVLMSNKMLRIYSGGRVSYVTRLSLKLSCVMDLHSYPFDRQRCILEMESFSYNDGNIVLHWANVTTRPVECHNVSLPQFQVKGIQVNETYREHPKSGNHSVLVVEFRLIRNIGYYLVQMYIPSALVVMLSWISFWLNVNAVPGRISLGVLTVLTMTTQSSSVNASLPRVSYTKAIDIWMVTCLVFVFLALIEFAVANVLSRKDVNKGIKFKNIFKIPLTDDKENPSATQTMLNSNVEHARTSKASDADSNSDEDEDSSSESSSSTDTEATEAPTTTFPVRTRTSHVSMSGTKAAMRCDQGARIMFPVVFVLFNLGYWAYFMYQLEETEDE